MIALALFLSTLFGSRTLAEERIELLELNWVMSSNGQVQLEQFVFWRAFQSQPGQPIEFCCLGWCNAYGCLALGLDRGDYCLWWFEGNLVRCLRARHFRETVTDYDPERLWEGPRSQLMGFRTRAADTGTD